VISAVRKGRWTNLLAPLAVAQHPSFILDIALSGRFRPCSTMCSMWSELGWRAIREQLELGRQAARLVDKILKGARPGDIRSNSRRSSNCDQSEGRKGARITILNPCWCGRTG